MKAIYEIQVLALIAIMMIMRIDLRAMNAPMWVQVMASASIGVLWLILAVSKAVDIYHTFRPSVEEKPTPDA